MIHALSQHVATLHSRRSWRSAEWRRPGVARAREVRVAVVLGVALAFGSGLLLHALHGSLHDARAINPVLHWLTASFLATPLAIAVVVLGIVLTPWLIARLQLEPDGGTTGLASRVTWALSSALLYALASVLPSAVGQHLHPGGPGQWRMTQPHVESHGAAGHAHGALPLSAEGAREVGGVLFAGFLILLAFALVYGVPWAPIRSSRRRARIAAFSRGVINAGMSVLLVASLLPLQLLAGFFLPAAPFVASAAAASQCSAANAVRSYNVAAIELAIPYNRWGDVDPDGQLFVLQGDKAAIKNWSLPLNANPAADPAGNRRLRPRPLVIRANVGECVKVTLTNELNPTGSDGLPNNPRVSLRVSGPSYDPQTSDGGAVGFNNDTTIAIGATITYFWRAPDQEGLYLFRDGATTASSEANGGSLAHGLFGALAVEPAGSTWTDPVSGAPLYSGTGAQSGELYIDADIHPPTGQSFRETVQLAQDEIPRGIGFGFNYGAEPQRNREAHLGPDSVGEETSLSSWVYGDPALVKLASGPGPWLPTPGNTNVEDCGLPGSCYTSNVVHSYRGDPAKVRFAMAGVRETHVFHMHAHQWRAEPHDPKSTTIDSQTFGPGEAFTADLLFGSGSKPGTVGDSIFHCHLYPHFADGFWSLFRTHDVLENGSQITPDGIKVRALQTLRDRAAQPSPTADNPGYPRFIPGEFGWRAPQPPGGISQNGIPATRIVAGNALTATNPKVQVERGVQLRNYNGAEPKPGAPLTDPCPSGAREVTYNVSVIQRDIVYNEAGWHDTQGRILVLDRDVDAVLNGTKEPEPLFFRVNAGDCINFNLTNLLPNWFGNDAFVQLKQTNLIGQHIHLVKFDVLGSDGSSNGWNYQEAAFSKEQVDFNSRVIAGSQSCNTNEATGACRIPTPTDWNPQWTGQERGQTIHERWYADYELRTVFTHDHHFPAVDQNRGLFGALIVEPQAMDVRNPQTGQFYQPINNPANGPVCGSRCEGAAAGAIVDLIGPGPDDDFREFGLAIQDFVSLTRAGGNPRLRADTFDSPVTPESFPDDDPGVMGINYRNAPFKLRQTKNGVPIDPAYVFSSTVWGDPMTPLLQAYGRDAIRIRLIQGSQEEEHVFNLHGVRWRDEPGDPQSPYVNSKAVGVSDAPNFEVPAMDCGGERDCRGDYLYSTTGIDGLYLGMWGLMRVYGVRVPTLLPLPDNVPQAGAQPAVRAAVAPPAATSPGNPCVAGAPLRQYHVVALEARIEYNEFGDHDPYGLMYTLVEDGETPEQAVIRARAKPEPLVLRANEGDCLEVRLTNKLTSAFLNHRGQEDGDAPVPLERLGDAGQGQPPGWTPAGLRVSLHPQLLLYDVRGSDGATVGYNRDQTVGPDESILYRWYADDINPGELGATNLVDYGDVRGHRHHGLFAGLNIEPKGATYHDPLTGKQIRSGASADIRVPGRPDFREFTLFFQDGLNLRDRTGTHIDLPDVPAEPGGEVEPPPSADGGLDFEDHGEKAFNYRNAPYRHRLGADPMNTTLDGGALAQVFSSTVHGDPQTPIFRAYTDDPVRMRILQGQDKGRQHGFQHSGHAWRAQPDDPNSNLIGTEGHFSVGRALNVHLSSAGGAGAYPGDYRYNCALFFDHLPMGLWGLMRVYAAPDSPVGTPDQLAAADNPHQAGYHPLVSLEQSELNVSVFNDTDQDTARSGAEPAVPDITVNVRATNGAVVNTGLTATDGQISFSVPAGTYDVEAVVPTGWTATTPATFRIAVGENARETRSIGIVQAQPTAPPGATVLLTVTSSGDGQVAPAGTTAHAVGSVVTLTATAGAGQVFVGWAVDGAAAGWANPLTLTLGADRAVAATFAPAPAFCDVAPGAASHAAVGQLAARGIIRGYQNGCFGPADRTLRAQMAALIVRAMGWGGQAASNPFPDQGVVDAELWGAVAILNARGVARGYPDGTYRPTQDVLHAQTISFISRAMVAQGFWQQQPVDPALFGGALNGSGHEADAATYLHYVGGIPGAGAAWPTWDQPATRGWFAQVLWAALDSHFGVDRTP